MLLVSHPLSVVLRSSAACMRLGAVPMPLVLEPMSIVHIAVSKSQLAYSRRLVFLPHTFILSAIREDSQAPPMLLAILELASVGTTVAARHVFSVVWVLFSLLECVLLCLKLIQVVLQLREEHLP